MLHLTKPFKVTREELRCIVRGMTDRHEADAFPIERLLLHASGEIGRRSRWVAIPSVCKEGNAWVAHWYIKGGTVKVFVVPQKPPSPWMKPPPTGQASIALDGLSHSVVYLLDVEEVE